MKLNFSNPIASIPANRGAEPSGAAFGGQLRAYLAKTRGKTENGGNTLLKQQNSILKKNPRSVSRDAARAAESRKQYERELRACRTKQEVEAVKLRWRQTLATEMQAIDQSGMSADLKASARLSVAKRLDAVEAADREFQQSAAFLSLPDDDGRKDREKVDKSGESDGNANVPAQPEASAEESPGGVAAGRESARDPAAQAPTAPPTAAPPTRPGDGKTIDVYA
ncbi:MAG: hypothetical protein LBI87_13135 [Candidatus Accumulibacter sp.]|jgi:hypothetical protein|nr:hypothetical protein [Accumulibacter sp.]